MVKPYSFINELGAKLIVFLDSSAEINCVISYIFNSN